MTIFTGENAAPGLSREDASPLQGLHFPYKLGRLQVEALRQVDNRGQCRVPLSLFQQSDKGTVVTGFVGQLFLGHVGRHSHGFKHLAESLCRGVVFGLI